MRFNLSLLLSFLFHAMALSVSFPVGPARKPVSSSHILQVQLTESPKGTTSSDPRINLVLEQELPNLDLQSTKRIASDSPTKHVLEHTANVQSGGSTEAASAQKTAIDGLLFEVPFQPFYPLDLLGKGVRGYITVQLRVDTEGRFQNIEIIDSHPTGAFDEAVLRSLASARVKVDAGLSNSRHVLTVVFDPSSLASHHRFQRE